MIIDQSINQNVYMSKLSEASREASDRFRKGKVPSAPTKKEIVPVPISQSGKSHKA